ncbi:MAG: glycoside hydrolase N-terminal domain-containing protein, partial [Kiritimatiellae bacterium]|nr:glycoside hydrolase N-terminal domain-containing protein [Kiritimatiellia bacterium]
MRIWVLAVLLASGAAWAQLPINSNLPVSFGVNSKQGERLDGTFTDVRVYARVLNPREIARLSRGAAISDDRLVWRGVPKIGETCDAVKQGDYRLGFTFAATVTANGKSGRLIDNVTPGGKDGWLIDIYQNKFRIVLSGGANNFHPTELELGKPHCLVATVAADGAWALWVDGKRHEPLAQAAPAPRRGWEWLYDRPAANWNAAVPVGNGRLGAMVFGGIAEERLQLNEDTIWSGSPGPNDDPGATPEQF